MKPNWFVALPLEAGDWFGPLVRTAPANVRVFHPSDVHITVAFLGACGEERARAAWAQVSAHEADPLPVTLGGLKAMGNPRRPSALSIVIEQGREPVAQLIGALRTAAWEAAGARPDDRPPLPHATVARPSRRASNEQRRAAVQWATSLPPVGAQVVVDRLALFTWAQDRRERQFRIVEQITLSSTRGAPAAGEEGSR